MSSHGEPRKSPPTLHPAASPLPAPRIAISRVPWCCGSVFCSRGPALCASASSSYRYRIRLVLASRERLRFCTPARTQPTRDANLPPARSAATAICHLTCSVLHLCAPCPVVPGRPPVALQTRRQPSLLTDRARCRPPHHASASATTCPSALCTESRSRASLWRVCLPWPECAPDGIGSAAACQRSQARQGL